MKWMKKKEKKKKWEKGEEKSAAFYTKRKKKAHCHANTLLTPKDTNRRTQQSNRTRWKVQS